MEKIKPPKLQQGDTVGIIAPASWPGSDRALKAAAVLKGMGLNVHFGQSLDRVHGYLAGTDEERAAEIHEMFRDERIQAVFCVCGGYGTGRIASRLDYELIRSHPKVFLGYSDITFLHIAITQKAGLVTFHGPMLSSDLGQDFVDPLTLSSLEQLTQPRPFDYTEGISPLSVVVEGKASGQLVGGNLSLMISTLGTPFEIDTKGKLLFIEEIDEEPYRIDRMLNQLKMAGKLDDAAGILLCDFNNCVPTKRKRSLNLEEIVQDHIQPAGKPTLSGFKVGHCSPNITIPVGVQATLDTVGKCLRIEESGVV